MEKKNKSSIETIIDQFLKVYFYLEIFMTDFIAFHIIPIDYSKNEEKRKEFIERFLDHAQFFRKSEVLAKIINDKFPQLKNKIPKKSLENIGKFRNKIAHSMDFTNIKIDNKFPDEILLQGFSKGELNQIQITYNEVKMKIECALSIIENLNDEVNKMKERNYSQRAKLDRLSHLREEKNGK